MYRIGRRDITDHQNNFVAGATLLSDDNYLTTVGFEDLRGGGDLVYNDLMFSLSNVIDPPAIPEPSVLLLLAISLIGLSVMGRRRRYMRATRI
jgi:PEP-CTERM motif